MPSLKSTSRCAQRQSADRSSVMNTGSIRVRLLLRSITYIPLMWVQLGASGRIIRGIDQRDTAKHLSLHQVLGKLVRGATKLVPIAGPDGSIDEDQVDVDDLRREAEAC